MQHWTDTLGPWFGLIGSIFVVYGFLSERVIDFRFAIGRAAIYGAVTAVLLLLFGVLEWWAEQIFESTRPAIYVSLFAALLIGFTLNALHGRVESFLNTFFYHDQRRAEEALRHAARALANTSSEKTLIEFLVDEPVRVLGLTSAALFLAQPEGGLFRRTADRGWSRQEAEQIDPEDPLIVELRAELAPIALDGRPRAETILPGGSEGARDCRSAAHARRGLRFRLLRTAQQRRPAHGRRAQSIGSDCAQRRCSLRSHRCRQVSRAHPYPRKPTSRLGVSL